MNDFEMAYRHPNWQKRRLEIFERDGFKCVTCEADHITLHVHHRYYERGKKPWEYPDEAFESLCEKCHADATLLDRTLRREIGQMDDAYRYQVLGYIMGLRLRYGSLNYTDDAPTESMSLEVCSGETLEGIADGYGLPGTHWHWCPERNDVVTRAELQSLQWRDHYRQMYAMSWLAAGGGR